MNIENKQLTPKQENDWIKENHTMQAGLIGASIVLIQPFMYQGEFVGIAAKVCAISFAVSVPLLAALLLLSFEEKRFKHITTSPIVSCARIVGQIGAQVGIAAAFWHVHPYAGIAMLSAGVLGGLAYMAGYRQLYGKRKQI